MTNSVEVLNALSAVQSKLIKPFSLNRDESKIDVVAILDEFSVRSFSDHLNLWLIEPDRFELDLDEIKPAFLFVESAWNGNNGSWKYMVTSNSGPKDPLINLVQACKERGIPSVFWNKEDPPHFEDFIRTARLFDHIFTSDADMIDEYKKQAPNATVQLLQFAASPHLHRPGPKAVSSQRDVAFAGQYFAHKFPERRQQMEDLFPVAMRHQFDIYSRVLGGDERYQFPEEFAGNIIGSLPYTEMVNTYRNYKVFLNVNSVVNSTTMCARRIFELSSCKTAVFGMESRAVRSVYNEAEIVLAKDKGEIDGLLNMLVKDDSAREAATQKAWRKTLSWHTYEHRIGKILTTLGLTYTPQEIDIYVAIIGESTHSFARFAKSQLFDGPNRYRLIEVNDSSLSSRPTEYLKLVVNEEFEYDEYYVYDLVLAMQQQQVNLVGKAPSRYEQESFSNDLPTYGWLEVVKDSEDVSSLDDPFETLCSAGNPSIYLSDAQGVTAKAHRTS